TKKFASGPKDGREKQYGAGEYKTLGGLAPDKPGWFGVSSIKVSKGFTLEAWDGPNFTGKKYGPVKGPYSEENLPYNSSVFPNDKIASIKVTGGPKASGQVATTSGYQACARKAFKVEQPLTESRNVAANAMKRWKRCSTPGGCGGDLPEANFFALHQLATEGGLTDGKGSSDKGFATGYKVGWRDDAGRIVVWLGDAPSHDTTVDKAEVTAALLNKKIVVEAINMSKKSTGLDSVGPQGGLLPHYCSIKTCRFHPYYCKLFACETKGFCATQWRKDFDCGLLKKPAPLGQATKISQLTYGDVHHEISGGSAVVKTILQAAATGITNAGVGSAVSFNGGFLTQESQVYIGSMNPIDWSGDLQAWPLDPKTAAVDVGRGKNWSAAKQLDAGAAASRVMMSYRPTETTPKGKTKMHSGVPFVWNALNDTQRTDLRLNDTGGLDKKGEARLSFLHGKRDHEGKGHKFRVRGSRLGDIWRSRPVHVGAPGAPTANARQCGALRPFVHGKNKRQRAKECQLQHAFAKWHHSRTPVVYVGANDGALHGFDARSGKEVLAYFPAALYALTRTGSRKAGGGYHRLSSPDYIHKEYVDSPPAVFDAYMKTPGSTRSQWRTVLVGGLGGGGRGIYALDVTQPRSFNQANAKKVVMWEFTSEDDPHVGYTHSEVRVGRMNNGRYAVIFGNGPRDTGSGTAQLFVVYLDGPGVDGKWDEGRDYVRISTGRGSLDDPNALFTPTIVDVDGDGTVDRAYAGDAYGNMWAFDLAGKRKKWQAKALLLKGGGQSGRQPITAAPLVIKPNLRWMGRPRGESPGLMVLFGTGIFLHDRHKAITNTNAFYAIYDRGVTVNDVASQLVRQRLKEKTYKTKSGVSRKIRLMGRSNSVVYEGRDDAANPPKLGWYVKLPNAGERVVSRASVSWTAEGQAVIYFNSIVPDISICSSGGDGWEMAVSLYNGGNPRVGSYDINEDGVVDAEDAVVKDGDEVPAGRRVQGKGMPAGPVIFAGKRWTATTEVTDASKLQITKLSVIGEQPTGRLSYEQLFLRE
ncbi:MAG: PilC/PilY family type IV pilus protein, partial [Pseudomonadota bacterium]|nr:PilC/PilY family type IV pilus protein [Pseudomonadota bacterium]